MRRRLWRLAALASTGLILAACLLPPKDLPEFAGSVWDKLQHFVAFALLGLTWHASGLGWKGTLALAGALALFTELGQAWLRAGRTDDVLDLLANLLGASLGLLVSAGIGQVQGARSASAVSVRRRTVVLLSLVVGVLLAVWMHIGVGRRVASRDVEQLDGRVSPHPSLEGPAGGQEASEARASDPVRRDVVRLRVVVPSESTLPEEYADVAEYDAQSEARRLDFRHEHAHPAAALDTQGILTVRPLAKAGSSVVLAVRFPDFAPVLVSLPPGVHEKTIELRPGMRVEGTVKTADGRHPVSGATVIVRADAMHPLRPSESCVAPPDRGHGAFRSDSKGYFSGFMDRATRLHCQVVADGFALVERHPFFEERLLLRNSVEVEARGPIGLVVRPVRAAYVVLVDESTGVELSDVDTASLTVARVSGSGAAYESAARGGLMLGWRGRRDMRFGNPAHATEWVFVDGNAGEDVSEGLVVLNTKGYAAATARVPLYTQSEMADGAEPSRIRVEPSAPRSPATLTVRLNPKSLGRFIGLRPLPVLVVRSPDRQAEFKIWGERVDWGLYRFRGLPLGSWELSLENHGVCKEKLFHVTGEPVKIEWTADLRQSAGVRLDARGPKGEPVDARVVMYARGEDGDWSRGFGYSHLIRSARELAEHGTRAGWSEGDVVACVYLWPGKTYRVELSAEDYGTYTKEFSVAEGEFPALTAEMARAE